MLDQFDVPNPRGRPQVIHDRKRFIEPLGRENMFVGDTFVFVSRSRPIPMKPDMVLPRHLTEALIIRHIIPPFYRFPRASCSRSRASKSALKFPFPKLLAPLR